ncbi:prenyltransferase [Natronocalculus amylovorans]|uniref:Prenyltransferase n=1 Tax=Natronocalculus amylovorans TaxID=2917812 RepID=A0AAE3FYW7_9EURY|nr:prenyltransferase [Natronocalculus amylovorans]MCL9817912.1 prenyltransferase [Natronocalculus amylovorans]
MARPDQLLLMVFVYLIGVLAGTATYTVAPPSLVSVSVGFGVYLPIALSVHYANEYADYETDRLTTRTRFSGGSGAFDRLAIDRQLAKYATIGTGILGGVLITVGVVTGVVSLFSGVLLCTIALLGWGYSVGPYPLAWNGLGEIDNALLGGVLLPWYGLSIAVDGSVPITSVLFFVPFGCAVFCNLLATTWPDRQADAAVGKFTLATQWPSSSLKRMYFSGVLGIILTTALAIYIGGLPLFVAIGMLAVTPLLFWSARQYTAQESPFPTVFVMLLFVTTQVISWAYLCIIY